MVKMERLNKPTKKIGNATNRGSIESTVSEYNATPTIKRDMMSPATAAIRAMRSRIVVIFARNAELFYRIKTQSSSENSRSQSILKGILHNLLFRQFQQ
jgi:hypothetical protein